MAWMLPAMLLFVCCYDTCCPVMCAGAAAATSLCWLSSALRAGIGFACWLVVAWGFDQQPGGLGVDWQDASAVIAELCVRCLLWLPLCQVKRRRWRLAATKYVNPLSKPPATMTGRSSRSAWQSCLVSCSARWWRNPLTNAASSVWTYSSNQEMCAGLAGQIHMSLNLH
jgi:hypothetical protein